MMHGILKVTPEKLMATAAELQHFGHRAKICHADMMGMVKGMRGHWNGEACEAYIGRFSELQHDMDRMHAMIFEYVRQLNEMAALYARAERMNMERGRALRAHVII